MDALQFLSHYSQINLSTFEPDIQLQGVPCFQRKCAVCDKQLTSVRPLCDGKCWCVDCGAMFDRLMTTAVLHKMWRRTGNTDSEPLGEFIGFAGYNQLLLNLHLLPRDVVTTHFKEGEMAVKFDDIHRFHDLSRKCAAIRK